jgi:methionyl-tRNA synthetase
MDQALEILPADYWRWWLMSNVPEGSDSNFTWESFQGGVNKDLADVLGNFVSRVTKFAAARFGATVPTGGAYGEAEAAVAAELGRRLAAYQDNMEAIELRKAAQELRAIWAAGNEYLQDAAPWSVIKTDPAHAAAITRFSLNLIRLYAVLSRPFLPDASDAMLAALGLESAEWPDDLLVALSSVPSGQPFTVPPVLFAKLDDGRRSELEARFAGTAG